MFNKVVRLLDLEDNYDAFLFDIWGVLHEGGDLYDGVIETFNYLSQKKIVRVISNAPRLKETTAKNLISHGLNIDPRNVFTSGEAARFMLSDPQKHLGIDKPVIFHIGGYRNEELLSGGDWEVTSEIENANLVVLSAYKDYHEDDSDLREMLGKSLALGLTILAANPDQEVLHLGKIRKCAGFYAKIYENMGGGVIYSGKPNPIIFHECFKSLESDGKKMIIIGDTFHTDIQGAVNVKIDSGLVITGNVGIMIGKTGITNNIEAVNKICAEQKLFPSHLVSMK
ncbi:MAG: TIGR01459 family HAD-type hydrolase [Rickettsiaceae bacterium]|nr:TIGR01459 family HAD-type hydrolase [Rickettsiaceae bacterium]